MSPLVSVVVFVAVAALTFASLWQTAKRFGPRTADVCAMLLVLLLFVLHLAWLRTAGGP